jgi:hypothetical protein
VSGDAVAVSLIFAVHMVALVIIIGPLARAPVEPEDDADGAGPSDDDGDGGSRRPFRAPYGPRPRGDLPLPDAVPARMRLRGPARLADAYRPPRRRSDPARRPVRR